MRGSADKILIWIFYVGLAFLIIVAGLFYFHNAFGSTLQDYYNTGDDDYFEIYSTRWEAQTFTAGSSYTITSVKLKLYCGGSCAGNLIVGIKAVDIYGYPTGFYLAQGTINSATLGGANGAFVEITLGAGASLTNGTQYAIVAEGDAWSNPNCPYWRADSSSPTYAGGKAMRSTDNGSTWGDWTNVDFMFETYSGGGVPPTPPTPTATTTNLFLGFDYFFTPYIYQLCGYIFFGAMVLAIVYIASKR